jgi:hypothetical protein
MQQQNLIQNIYEITGISDLMRSVSNTNETATASLQKGKFGSLRLQQRQEALNNYIKDVYKICAHIICEMYSAQTLQKITEIKLPDDIQKAEFENTMQMRQELIKAAKAKGKQIQMTEINPK